MSATIEDRVVEMRFDNADFEKGAKNTMNTLKDLDNSLKFENAGKGFSSITDAANGVNLSSLVSGIEGVSTKFSAMEIAAITVISNITSAVMGMVSRITNELAIKPITEGFEEYETKMDMVQTTMINSGKSLSEVNGTLDDLNHYADKTIFKFSDMTSALSKFTMAGVTDLDVAKSMIEGIGNAAGEAGLKTEQASSAFYMISQAMSSGKMSLYQWRTLETTGFASVKFRQNLIDTGVALGKIKDIGNGTYAAINEKGKQVQFTIENMRNTLTETGWIDKDTMQAAFSRYGSAAASLSLGLEDISEKAFLATTEIKTFSQMWDTLKEAAQSGWTESWEIIIGDYEQAKKLWTGVNNVISGILDKQSEGRNAILREWAQYTGRIYSIDGIRNMWESVRDIVTSVSNALQIVFPPITGKRLAEISKSFWSFSERIKPTEHFLDTLSKGFKAFGVVIRTVVVDIKTILGIFKTEFREMFPKKVFDGADFFRDRMVDLWHALQKLTPHLEGFRTVARALFSVVDIGVMLVKELYKAAMPIIKTIFPQASGGVWNLILGFSNLIIKMRDFIKEHDVFAKAFGGIANAINKVISIIKTICDVITKLFKPSWDVLKESLFGGSIGNGAEDGTSFLERFAEVLKRIVTVLGEQIEKLAPIVTKVKDIFKTIFGNIVDGLSNFINNLTDVRVGNAMTMITAGFGSLLGLNAGWKIFDNIGDVFGAVKDWSKGIGNVLVGIDDLLNGFNELKDQAKFSMIANSLKQVAISIGILAISFAVLSRCDMVKVSEAFGIITVTIGELIGTMAVLNKLGNSTDVLSAINNPLKQLTSALLKFSVSVLIMAVALKMLSKIEPDRLGVAMLGLTGILIEMTIVTSILSKNETGFVKTAKSLTKMAVSMVIFAVALKIMSKIEPERLWNSVAAMGVLMIALAAFVKVVSKVKPKQIQKMGEGMVLIAASMILFAKAISAFGEMSAEQGLAGMMILGSILTAIALFSQVIGKNSTAMVKVGVAMIAIAASMLVFGAALAFIGNIPWQKLLIGVGVIAALIAGITLASNLVKPVKVIALAGALAIIAASLLIFAAAMTLISKIPFDTFLADMLILLGSIAVLGVLAVVLQPFMGALAGLVAIIAVFSVSILALGVGVVALSAGLAALGVALATFGGSFVVFFTEVLSLIPIFFEMLAAGIVSFLAGLASSVSEIVKAVVMIVTAILDALIETIPKFVEFVIVLVSSLLDALVVLVPKVIETLVQLVIAIWDALMPLFEKIWPKLKEWLGKLWDKVKAWWDGIKEKIHNAIEEFRTNLKEKAEGAISAVADLLNRIKESIENFKDKMFEAATNLIQGFINGIKSKIEDAVNAVKELGGKVVDKIRNVFDEHSPSKVAYTIGEFFDLGLVDGIRDTAGKVEKAAEDMANGTVDLVKEAINNIVEVIENDDYQPKITPVLDLSNIEQENKKLNSIFGNQNKGNYSVGVLGRLSAISGNMSASKEIVAGEQNITNNFNMTQNNTSPKALSAIDIYRQTKSQFAQLKGLVNQS